MTQPDSHDAAWAEAEAALPEDWELKLTAAADLRDFYTATASYSYSLRHYREHVGKARWTPFEMAHGPTPAKALRALAACLRGDAIFAALPAKPGDEALRTALDVMATRWENEADVRVGDLRASAASLLVAGVQRAHAMSVRAVLVNWSMDRLSEAQP